MCGYLTCRNNDDGGADGSISKLHRHGKIVWKAKRPNKSAIAFMYFVCIFSVVQYLGNESLAADGPF